MAHPINKLTDRKVASLKKVGRHSDGGGLYLRITAQGARSWIFMTTLDGKRAEIGLGSLGGVSLASARRLAERMRETVAAGCDPRAVLPKVEEKTEPTVPEVPSVPTFGGFADAILADILPGFKNAKHRQQWTNTLNDYAAVLRPIPIDEVNTEHVLTVIRPIWSTKNETASRVRGRIERILGAAKAAGHRPRDSQNPAAWDDHLEHFLVARRKADKGHHAAVPWDSAPIFWSKLALRRNSSSVEALRLTILTAARTSEMIRARRKEVDLDLEIWTVPPDRMKMQIEHKVALSRQAVEIFRRRCEGLAPDDFIFPGSGKSGHLSNMAMLMLLQDDMGREETVHGFRSTFRDWAGDATEFPRELAEHALAHAVGDESEQAYRRGTAVKKRRPLMQAWADYLDSGQALHAGDA